MFKNKGFSLLELLLVVGILAAIFSFSAPFLLDFYTNQLTGDTQSNIIDALQRARHNAVLQKNDSNFGVHIVAGSYIIFQTPDLTYTNRVSAQDEIFPVVNKINFTGPANIIFSKFTGLPSATGTIILNYGSIAKGVTIDNTGSISKASTLPVGGLAVSDGLISYWSFDGNATDSVGSNNGTVNGATLTSGIKGLLNTAYSFNAGSNQYINFSNVLGTSNNLTVVAWIYPSSVSGMQEIVSKWNNGNAGDFHFYLNGNHLYMARNSTPGTSAVSGAILSSNTWYQVAGVYDGTNMTLYVNGTQSGSPQVSNSESPSSVNFLVGAYYNLSSLSSFFSGSIDSVRIYNRALTADEVTTIYNSEKP